MQVYVQKSTRTTCPRRPAAVSGGELSQPVAPVEAGQAALDRQRPDRAVTAGHAHELRHVDDCVGERVRRFLGQVVADATGDRPVLVLAGELCCVRVRLGMRCAVGVTFERDGGNGDARERRRAAPRSRRTAASPRPGRAATDSCGSRWRRGPGCRTTPRCGRRWRRRSSTAARRSARSASRTRGGWPRSRPGRARWRSSTGTTTAARPPAAAAPVRRLAADEIAAHRDQRRCSAPAIARR